jgi:hypothetical protein
LGQQADPVNLLSEQQWVRFDVVLGRVTATHLRGGQGPRLREADGESCHERLAIDGDGAHPSVRYEQIGEQRIVRIQLLNRTDVEITVSTPTEELPVVHFRQQPAEPVSLAIGQGAQRHTFRASSIWHLLLAEPDVCRSHLLPLLALLRSDWQLEETATRIEQELFRFASRSPALNREQLQELVQQLNAHTFSERQAADRELRRLGVSILTYLREFDTAMLSEEQRMRIRGIEEYLSSAAADSASRVAIWLVNDKAIWLDLLAHREPAKREAAVSHLAGIHTGQIQFDPFAEQARRDEQIARLRLRLVGY